MVYEIELIGEREVVGDLTGIAVRSVHLEPAFEAAFQAQERAQAMPFANGELVRTGNLRASLTQPHATGAIREAHGTEGVFGTSVRYARPAAARSGKHVLVEPVPELADLTLAYIVGEPL
jgi:hypothetical protein